MVGTSRHVGRLLQTRRGASQRRRAPNPIAVRPGLWLALLGAVALYLYSRTSSGSAMVGKVVSGAGDAVSVVRDLFAPRGIRNHNPGNIKRTADQWRGMSSTQGDAVFVQFDAPVWGLRALARVLRKYQQTGNDTVREIINRWAPPVENITSAYVDAVARALGIDPDDVVTEAQMPALMAAIVHHENGQQPYEPELFAQAIRLEQSA